VDSFEVKFKYLKKLLDEKLFEEFRHAIDSMDPADLADFLEELSEEDKHDHVFQMLDDQTASDVITELEHNYVDDVIEELSPEQLAKLTEKMPPDEAADFLAELDDPEQSSKILNAMTPQAQLKLRELLQYEEDSAGHIMTPEVITQPATAKVLETRKLLAKSDLSDPVINIYVIEPNNHKLLGYVTVKDLLSADGELLLADITNRDYIYATTDEDQESVALKFQKYDLWVMPVVDNNHCLLGRITIDDIMDVVQEEADEDLAHLVGAPDIDEEEEAIIPVARLRLPWLVITLCVGLLNSVIIRGMLSVVEFSCIVAFVPVICAMGGNVGMQSSAICIRGIALGQQKYHRLASTVFREIRIGLLLGLVCGIIAATLVILGIYITQANSDGITPWRLALTVGIAMFNSMTFACCYGAIVPIVLHRIKIDPAVASGPFITTSNDLSSTIIYFLSCWLLLK